MPTSSAITCACCGSEDIRESCELCAGPVCGDCVDMVADDVLLCLRCAEFLAPCTMCDGPTQPPAEIAEEGTAEGSGDELILSSRPQFNTFCAGCEGLYCRGCAADGRCPMCGEELSMREGSGPAEG